MRIQMILDFVDWHTPFKEILLIFTGTYIQWFVYLIVCLLNMLTKKKKKVDQTIDTYIPVLLWII